MHLLSLKRFLTMAGCVLLVALGGVAAAIAPAPGQKSSVQEMPGPLSPAHAGTPGPNCQACHDANFKAIPQKCLACHQEIGRQASAPKGYHRDKREGCADCHAEHQGEGKSLVPLDIKDFDHAETGTVLRGGHQKVVGCDSCHRPEVSFPRAKTKSYILKESGCRACHRPPHAGRQDDCLACHDQNSWTVDRVNGGK